MKCLQFSWVLGVVFFATGCAASVAPIDGSVSDAGRNEGGMCLSNGTAQLTATVEGGLTGSRALRVSIGPAAAATIETPRCGGDNVCTFNLRLCRSEGAVSFEEFTTLARSTEVVQALRARSSFGMPVPDGVGLTVTDASGGSFIVWGVDCMGVPTCVTPPTGVQKLVEFINSVVAASAAGGCNCI